MSRLHYPKCSTKHLRNAAPSRPSSCYEVDRRFAGGPRGEISNFGPGQSCMGGAGLAVSGSEGLGGGAPPLREP